MSYVLDAWAALAMLADESSAERVAAVVAAGEAGMNWANLCEVAYLTERRRDRDAADRVVEGLAGVLAFVDPVDESLARSAASVKARGGLSLADAFAAASALDRDAVLLTGDPDLLHPAAPWRSEDLRGR